MPQFISHIIDMAIRHENSLASLSCERSIFYNNDPIARLFFLCPPNYRFVNYVTIVSLRFATRNRKFDHFEKYNERIGWIRSPNAHATGSCFFIIIFIFLSSLFLANGPLKKYFWNKIS